MIEWLEKWFKPKPAKNVLSDRGENVAARFLRGLGYKIITRNFRCDVGEIDIIARDRDTLVFVEVKTRTYDDPTPEEQVNATKQHQITKAAKYYLSRYGLERHVLPARRRLREAPARCRVRRLDTLQALQQAPH